MNDSAKYLCLGAAAGFISAFFGIGGGIILVPALIIIFNFTAKKAVGTSLATIIFTALVGLVSHFLIKPSNVNISFFLFILVGGIGGTLLGALLVKKSPEPILKKLFAVFLVVVAAQMLGLISIEALLAGQQTALPNVMLAGVGLVAGLASALFGIGGGLIYVPAMNILFGLGMHSATATSIALIVPTVSFGAFFHKKMGNSDFSAVKFIAPGAFAGAIIGAIMCNITPAPQLKMLFGLLLVAVAAKLFLSKTT